MHPDISTPFTPRQASTRAGLAHWTVRRSIRPLEYLIPDGVIGIKITRRVLAGMMAGAGTMPRDVQVVSIDSITENAGRIKGEWVRPAAPRSGVVILYIHGSGYSLCSTKTHRRLVSRLARASSVAVFSTAYRLAPEHPFPTAADDIERAYDWLLSEGLEPHRLVIVGDSAGGHLALDLVLRLRREGRALPAALVMFSPLADLTCSLIAEREKAVPDAMISAAGVRRLLAHYLGDTDPRHPRLSHVIGAGETLPPTLIQAGGAEFLAADAHHLADMLEASGTDVRLEVWPGQMHVFQAANRIVPEADKALRRASKFIVAALESGEARVEAVGREVTA